MGTDFKNNDTLQLTTDQGFPSELEYNKHCQNLFVKEQFEGKVFSFKDKPGLRNFQAPPVRIFLVQNVDGKWLYWGTIQMLSIQHDYLAKTTSGTYSIKEIFTPEQMKHAYDIVDADKGKSYLEQLS